MAEEKKLTGYPSIDKPWLKYYSEEVISAPLPECSIYEYLLENNKNFANGIAINYYGRKITYSELFDNIDLAVKGFFSLGVRTGDIVTIFSTNTPETIYTIFALNRIGAIANLEYVTESEKEAVSSVIKCNSHGEWRTYSVYSNQYKNSKNGLVFFQNVRFWWYTAKHGKGKGTCRISPR